MMIRVRFAPSPTGYLHVGGARTALFNWLFARHQEGTFILRIEDTDKERSTDASIEEILESMRWLGLDWDEYYRQTDRTDAHLLAAQGLMDRGLAYEEDGAWWFRVPTEGRTVVHDDLLGDVEFPNDLLKDFVIRRSDGSFIYHFVVVVDDADMEVTHVIRGDDHLNNTPKHVLLFEALGRTVPRFVHLPMILGADRTRLSKRHGDTAVLDYRERGFLPEAMVNFLARLGWAHGDDEVFDRKTLIELFTIAEVNKSGAIFEDTKLMWLNQQHMKLADLDRLLGLIRPMVLELGRVTAEMWDAADSDHLAVGAHLFRDRCKTLRDLASTMELLFPVPLVCVDEIVVNAIQAPLMLAVADALASTEPFDPETIERDVRAALESKDAKLKDVA
ncbi:glutamate--tRNA ligase, partial [Candidatus Bipolaricaulota bacterium]|nr:glutamate--tRNA ligase [Candidatus Bipolaricaulota bacterium]